MTINNPASGQLRISGNVWANLNAVVDANNTGTAGITFGNGATSPRILYGAGTPEGAKAANPGSLYLRTDGGAAHLYVKETGTGNTGWVAK